LWACTRPSCRGNIMSRQYVTPSKNATSRCHITLPHHVCTARYTLENVTSRCHITLVQLTSPASHHVGAINFVPRRRLPAPASGPAPARPSAPIAPGCVLLTIPTTRYDTTTASTVVASSLKCHVGPCARPDRYIDTDIDIGLDTNTDIDINI